MLAKKANQNPATSKRRATIVGLSAAVLTFALVSVPVLFGIIIAAAGGDATLGGPGAAAQPNTKWWAGWLALGSIAAGLFAIVGVGYVAYRLTVRRQRNRSPVATMKASH